MWWHTSAYIGVDGVKSAVMGVEKAEARAREVVDAGWGVDIMTREMYLWALPRDLRSEISR